MSGVVTRFVTPVFDKAVADGLDDVGIKVAIERALDECLRKGLIENYNGVKVRRRMDEVTVECPIRFPPVPLVLRSHPEAKP